MVFASCTKRRESFYFFQQLATFLLVAETKWACNRLIMQLAHVWSHAIQRICNLILLASYTAWEQRKSALSTILNGTWNDLQLGKFIVNCLIPVKRNRKLRKMFLYPDRNRTRNLLISGRTLYKHWATMQDSDSREGYTRRVLVLTCDIVRTVNTAVSIFLYIVLKGQ